MSVFRKRLWFWVARAYLRKWGKVIFFSFVAGLVIFFALLNLSRVLVNVLPLEEKTRVGIVGAYTLDSLPPDVTSNISMGLTKISPDGKIEKGAAESWEVKDGGKTYVVKLKDGMQFSDGSRLNSDSITYNFKDVTTEKTAKDTVTFKLKDQYAPFLVTLARPILKGNLSGLGQYIVDDVSLNGNFIKSLTLVSRDDKYKSIQYIFYPSEEALKIAFALGEIDQAKGLTGTEFKDTDLTDFPGAKLTKGTNYTDLVTVFYNTNDAVLSDPKVRKSLTYSLPSSFKAGERAGVPYPKTSLYAKDEDYSFTQDLEHAQALLDATEVATAEGELKLSVKTLPKYKALAGDIAKEWKKLGIETEIEEVSSVPTIFQIYLGDFSLPRDPDQYVLWHSEQQNNITRYRNLRIDKLLEDGRKTTNQKEREEIYADFQKYLLEDAPAAFLYFPYEFTLEKST